jgi:hypothetical protein
MHEEKKLKIISPANKILLNLCQQDPQLVHTPKLGDEAVSSGHKTAPSDEAALQVLNKSCRTRGKSHVHVRKFRVHEEESIEREDGNSESVDGGR